MLCAQQIQAQQYFKTFLFSPSSFTKSTPCIRPAAGHRYWPVQTSCGKNGMGGATEAGVVQLLDKNDRYQY